MAQNEPTRRAAPNQDIPDKLYFRIGDVAKLCGVPAYVLRFWEVEFPQLKPNKGGTGQRLYRRRDVETALRIKRLLYVDGYTIPGARQALKSEQHSSRGPQLALAIETPLGTASSEARRTKRLESLRKELQQLCSLLSRAPGEYHPGTLRAVRPTRPRTAHHLSLADAAAGAMDDLFRCPATPGESSVLGDAP